MGFSYRHSAAPDDIVLTGATFQGRPDDPQAIHAEMEKITRAREASQPIREKTGGSTFKNPPGLKAWELIDKAGCRGLSLGGAQVSTMHCNFLINAGQATAADLEALGEEVKRRVLDTSGVALEWEIKRIGIASGLLTRYGLPVLSPENYLRMERCKSGAQSRQAWIFLRGGEGGLRRPGRRDL